ncbi:hypothetical protein [Rhodoplanes serenus]|uniref:hypothetical protein n=1 Tax=Rhodoplanes serenus TaxID=200615 RepID=UPI000DAB402D|nr:hypothetical protein [Rhodoplanes serenus]RAI30700.1 hypothetical protein CH340_20805 [Rhodoplanes serenus]
MASYFESDRGRDPLTTAVSTVGIVIRYGFHLVGALVLGLIGLGLFTLWGYWPTVREQAPSFRLADPGLERLPVRALVAESRGLGRVEIRHYGQVHSRGQDITVALVLPPRPGFGAGSIAGEVRDLPDLRRLPTRFGSTHWDLETRHGEVRAVDLAVNADGLRKQCLAFLSRFDTTAFYIKGWYCEGDGSRPSPGHLACLIDRLELIRPLAAKDADAALRAGMTRPMRCSGSPVVQTSDPRGPNPSVARKANPYAPPRY